MYILLVVWFGGFCGFGGVGVFGCVGVVAGLFIYIWGFSPPPPAPPPLPRALYLSRALSLACFLCLLAAGSPVREALNKALLGDDAKSVISKVSIVTHMCVCERERNP